MTQKDKLEDVEWTTEDETQLFFALDGLHIMGVNKHFSMALLVERLNTTNKLSQEIASDAVWAKLRTMYNLDKLDELEDAPFEIENFSLPEELRTKAIVEVEPEPKVEPKPEVTTKPPVVREEKRNSTPSRESDAKRTLPKRTRGSTSLETSNNSPSTPNQGLPKRRRI